MTKFTHTLIFVLLFACFGAGTTLAQTRAYVTNSNSNTVSIINTQTRLVTATIPVGPGPIALTVTPNGLRLRAESTGRQRLSD